MNKQMRNLHMRKCVNHLLYYIISYTHIARFLFLVINLEIIILAYKV